MTSDLDCLLGTLAHVKSAAKGRRVYHADPIRFPPSVELCRCLKELKLPQVNDL